MSARYVASLAVGLAAAPATAQPMTSLYSDLSPGLCEARSARASAKAQGPVAYRCRSPFGPVALAFHGAHVSAALPDGSPALPAPQLFAGYDIGPRIEWRVAGPAPRAAIVRLSERIGAARVGAALAVLRIEPARTCLAGMIDAAAPRATEAARAAADEAATAFRCGADKPQRIGAFGAAAQALAERNGL